MIPHKDSKPIPGYPHYLCNRKGQVFSLRHNKFLKPGTMPQGHQSVVLGRKAGSVCVHHIVLITFVGPRPEGHECLHLDGNPANNHLNNLKWGTRSENLKMDYATGVRKSLKGRKHGPRTPEQIERTRIARWGR